MDLTNYGFYIGTTNMLGIQQTVRRFAVFLIARHQEMFDALKAKLAEMRLASPDDPVLNREACHFWGNQLAGAPPVIDALFSYAEIDTGFKLFLYPDPKDKRTYGVCVTNYGHWYLEWLKQSKSVEYRFEEQEGCKLSLGTEEWEKRRAVWRRLIPDPKQPRLFAFVIDPVRYGSPLGELDYK